MFLHQSDYDDKDQIEGFLVKTVSPPSLGSYLGPAKPWDLVDFARYEQASNPGHDVMLPGVAGHVWLEEEGVYRLGGPGRWALLDEGGADVAPKGRGDG